MFPLEKCNSLEWGPFVTQSRLGNIHLTISSSTDEGEARCTSVKIMKIVLGYELSKDKLSIVWGWIVLLHPEHAIAIPIIPSNIILYFRFLLSFPLASRNMDVILIFAGYWVVAIILFIAIIIIAVVPFHGKP
jgi:hypothetical protein